MTGESQSQTRVAVAGGGVAALEAVLALRALAGDRLAVTMLAPDEHFVYQPLSVKQPFALGEATRYPLARVAEDLGIELRRGALASVDASGRTARTSEGETISYDALLVAVGAGREPAFEHAVTFRGREDGERAHGIVQDIEAGYVRRIAFVVPPGTAWSLPLYELALMTAGRARETSADVELTFVTPEESPLAVFGPRASEEVGCLLSDAGVRVETGVQAAVERKGEVLLRPGSRRVECDRILALPRIVGRRVEGLPSDENGFVPIDEHARVPGVEAVWAAGDGTAFPVKQGGIACQQADAAAADIARLAGADVEAAPFRPVLRGQLLTGSQPRYITDSPEDAEPQGSPGALLWSASKVAGVYLAPYLGELPEVGPEREPEVPLDVPPNAGEAGSRIWI